MPLALLSAAWTASSSAPTQRLRRRHDAPGPARRHHACPSQAIKAPASVSAPGAIAPACPTAPPTQVVAGASTSGIPRPPSRPTSAPRQVIDAADRAATCLGADRRDRPGRVRPRPRTAATRSTDDGVATPGIYGIALDGTQRHRRRSRDTDAGAVRQGHRSTTARSARCSSSPRPGRSSGSTPTATASATRRTSTTPRSRTAVYLCSGTDDLAHRAGPAGRGLPLQPQPALRRPGAARSCRPTPRATTPRCRTAPTAAPASPRAPPPAIGPPARRQAARGGRRGTAVDPGATTGRTPAAAPRRDRAGGATLRHPGA